MPELKLEEAVKKLWKKLEEVHDEKIKQEIFSEIGRLRKELKPTKVKTTQMSYEPGKELSKIEAISELAKHYQGWGGEATKAEKAASNTLYLLENLNYKIDIDIIDNICKLIDIFIGDNSTRNTRIFVGNIVNAAYSNSVQIEDARRIAQTYYTRGYADEWKKVAKTVKNSTINTILSMSRSKTELEYVLKLIRQYRMHSKDQDWIEHGSYKELVQVYKAVCRTIGR